MDKTRERGRPEILFAYRMFYTCLLSGALYICLREPCGFQGSIVLQLLALGGLLGLLAAVGSSRGGVFLVFSCVVLGACAALGLARGSADDPVQKEMSIWETFPWEKFLFRLQVRELWYLILLSVFVCLLWALAELFLWVRWGIALSIVAGLCIAMVLGQDVSHQGVAAFMLYLAATVVEHLQRKWDKQKQKGDRQYFLWLVPFLAGYFLLLVLLPYRKTPYEWTFVKNLYQRAQKGFTVLTQNLFPGDGGDFGLSVSGFSDTPNLVDGVIRQKKDVFLLKGWPLGAKAVYLTGNYFDTFDGRSWLLEEGGGEQDALLDTLETMYAIQKYDTVYTLDYARTIDLEVEYRYFHTKYVFAPLKTLTIGGLREGKDYRQAEGHFQFRKRKGYGTHYQLRYYQLNLGHPDFTEFLLALPMEEDEKAWGQVLYREIGNDAKISLESLLDYRESIRQRYLKKPKTGEQAERWLAQIMEGAETDYEKLKRLESALGSFTYQMQPGALPERVDGEEAFLDYFLLESRQGYCTHFATAFVLLARAAGIPARYVQGFCVPGEAQAHASAKETLVTSEMAHAWPEAYVEGIGWLAFEPTPGFSVYQNTPWQTSGDREREAQEAAKEAEQRTPYEGPLPWEKQPQEETIEEPEDVQEGLSVWDCIWIAFCLFGGAAVLFGLFLAGDMLWERARKNTRSIEEHFRLELQGNLQILAAMGYVRAEAETLSELNGRLERGEAFLLTCEETLYGKRALDEALMEELRSARYDLLQELKKKRGRRYPAYRAMLYLRRPR